MTDIYETISSSIIKEQVNLIGPIATEVASKVSNLSINNTTFEVHIQAANKADIVDALIARFEAVFGDVSVEVSRDAVKSMIKDIPVDAVPRKLQ
jgi:ribosomal protein L23